MRKNTTSAPVETPPAAIYVGITPRSELLKFLIVVNVHFIRIEAALMRPSPARRVSALINADWNRKLGRQYRQAIKEAALIGMEGTLAPMLAAMKQAHYEYACAAQREANGTMAEAREQHQAAWYALGDFLAAVDAKLNLPSTAVPSLPPVDDEDIAILRVLADSAPQLLTLYEIAAVTKITRKTIGERLARMLGLNLAARPKGEKSGTTITTAGTALLAEIRTPK